MMVAALERIESALDRVGSRSGSRGLRTCPAHDDRTPSLSVTNGDGRVLLKCHAGCETSSVLDALGLKMGDLFDEPRGASTMRQHVTTKPQKPPSTHRLVDYATERKLDIGFLRSLGLCDSKRASGPCIEIPYRDTTGNVIQHRDRTATGTKSRKGVPVMLYGLDRLQRAEALERDPMPPVVIVEGESDCHALWAAGHEGLGVPGAGSWPAALRHPTSVGVLEHLAEREVFFVQEPGKPGRDFAEAVSASLPHARVLRFDGAKDPSELWMRDPEAFERELLAAQAVASTLDESQAEPSHTAKPRLILLADVTHRRVEWVWRGRIPSGKVSVIDGDPGLGKSTLTLDLAARITRGSSMPDGTVGADGTVVLLSAEDDAGDTIAPRFAAAGGDPTRCAMLDGLPDSNGGTRPPALPTDAIELEQIVGDFAAKLLVVDPLMAFLADDVRSGSDHNIRRALAPLKTLAERTGAAVLLVRHLNKDRKNGSAVHRGGGSIGIIGAARSGLVVARDPEDEDRRVLAVVKANLAPPDSTGSLGFRVASAPNGVGVIEWLGVCGHSADDLMRVPDHDDGAHGAAVEFLRAALADGGMLTSDLEADAKAVGISVATLKRARASLGVIAEKGFDSKWRVRLPERAR